MASLPTKRPRSESPQGEPGPHSVKVKMDDTKIANDIALDRQVKDELSNLSRHHLDMTARLYHLFPDDPVVNSEAVCPLASILLPAIFKGNQHSLVARYEDIIKSDLSLVKMLMDAYKNGTYGNIRRIDAFCSLHKEVKEATMETIDPPELGQEATVKSWDTEFIGDIPTMLHGILCYYMTIDIESLYARVVAHVQSSGTGKSRAHDELAKHILYIPLNLAGPSATTYPPRDPQVAKWFASSHNDTAHLTQNRCRAFLHALLFTTLSHLKDISDDETVAPKIQAEPYLGLQILASEFRNRMAKGRTFEAHGDYRTKFYDVVYRRAEENVKAISHFNRPFTPPPSASNILPSASATRSPQHKPPAGDDAAHSELHESNNDDEAAIGTEAFKNDPVSTIKKVAEAIIKVLDPQNHCKSPHVVLCWDESHCLVEPVPKARWTTFSQLRRALRTILPLSYISIFLSTAGKFHQFTPSPEFESSNRVIFGVFKMLRPITEVSFDQFAEKVDYTKGWTLARIASTHYMAHLGRALFPTRFDNGEDSIKNSIVTFAAAKLLCREKSKVIELNLTAPESLACLAVRLGLDFNATSWLDRDAERTQVERHMRICLAATDGFRMMFTISPSEPLLAEASWMVMRKWLGPKEAPAALLQHINDSYLNAGDRGEVVGALLLLLARDNAIRNRETLNPEPSKPSKNASPTELKHDGVTRGRIVTVLEFLDALVPPASRLYVRELRPIRCSPHHSPSASLAEVFAEANIYFNHFIKVHDSEILNREYLWRLLCRGAAVICANNQCGVDLVVPVLRGNVLHPRFITAILIQVKNDARFTNRLSRTLFTVMDPFKINFFSKDDDVPPPILRIVFALASERSSVVAPSLPTRCSPRLNSKDKFTAYDLWIAGVSSQSFGVIPDKQAHDQYRLLLHCTRNVFNGYGAVTSDGGALNVEEAPRIDWRRMMHAAAASGALHFQNYIENPAISHKDRGGMDEGEDGGRSEDSDVTETDLDVSEADSDVSKANSVVMEVMEVDHNT